MPKIEKLFAFIMDGEGEGIVPMQIGGVHIPLISDGEEGAGIVSMLLGDVHMPLIGGDICRVEVLMPFAQRISDKTGKKIDILEFSDFKKIGEINPRQGGEGDTATKE